VAARIGFVQTVRVYDPDRRPASWAQIIGPRQFVLFARDLDSGVPCGTDGRPFASPELGTCVICDSLAEAQAVADAAVQAAPSLRIDVFDAEGRARPPLLTLVHPSRAQEAETHPRVLGRRRIIAWALVAAGIPLIAFAYVEHKDRDIILPAFIGINMLLAGGRLLWFNLAVRETERVRAARLDDAATPDAETKRRRVG
jgi:hypothetical protein